MFTVSDLLEATGGALQRGDPRLFVNGISIDSRTLKGRQAFVAIRGKNFDGHDFIGQAARKGASCIILERAAGVPGSAAVIKVQDTTRALAEIARSLRLKFKTPVIAVTGSNGKTTTKEMAAWVLSAKFSVLKNEGTENNHIGVPLTLFRLGSVHDIAVLEMGTNHFGEIAYLARTALPDIGIITNIGPAHLESFGDLKGVLREKRALLDGLRKPGIAILNADDSLLRAELKKRSRATFAIGVGVRHPAEFRASAIKRTPAGLEFLVNEKFRFTLRTQGYYNIYNALSAIAAGRVFGLSYKDIASRLARFEFPRGRLTITQPRKIRLLDDTYNANPASLAQALEMLRALTVKGRKILVMGDMLELGRRSAAFHRKAGAHAARICDIFITVGRRARLAAEAARSSGMGKGCVYSCDTSQEAAELLCAGVGLKAGDAVLVKGSRMMKMEEVCKRIGG